jgi:uncharacterized protein YecA (UPF0149 family)
MSTQRTPKQLADAALATIENLMYDANSSPAVRLKAALALLKATEGKTETTDAVQTEAALAEVESDPTLYEPVTTIRRDHPKVGRNDLCSCGSNLKFKRCCLNKPRPLAQAA